MSCPSFTIGEAVDLEVRAKQNDVLIDPAEVTVRVKLPDGSTVVEIYNGGAGNVTRESEGIYHLNYVTTQAGLHYWRGETTTPTGAEEASFQVDASAVL